MTEFEAMDEAIEKFYDAADTFIETQK